MGIENMSDEELNAALLAEINPETQIAEDDSTTTSQYEETSQEEETQEDSAEEEVEEQQPQDIKPKKSNVAKILSEKNYWKQKAKELESKVWDSRETDLEYINATAAKVASEMYAENKFFDENPEAYEVIDILKWEDYSGLDLDRAWKLYQVENNPEWYQIKQNKANAKKYDTTSYSNPKLKVEKPVKDLSLEELKQRLALELKAGKVTI